MKGVAPPAQLLSSGKKEDDPHCWQYRAKRFRLNPSEETQRGGHSHRKHRFREGETKSHDVPPRADTPLSHLTQEPPDADLSLGEAGRDEGCYARRKRAYYGRPERLKDPQRQCSPESGERKAEVEEQRIAARERPGGPHL